MTSSPAPPCMWMSKNPGASAASPKSTREASVGNFFRGARGNLGDAPVFHDEQRVLNLLDGSVEAAGGECGFHEGPW